MKISFLLIIVLLRALTAEPIYTEQPLATTGRTSVATNGQLGATYSDTRNWVRCKQSLGYSGHQSDYEIMGINDTMEQGIGYWIITDSDRYLEVYYSPASQRIGLTRITNTSILTAGFYDAPLPSLVSGQIKKL